MNRRLASPLSFVCVVAGLMLLLGLPGESMGQKKKPPLPKPNGPINPKITKANFDKVQLGMEYGEVAEILGNQNGGSKSGNMSSGRWEKQHNSPEQIVIDFVSGKVSKKSHTLNLANEPIGTAELNRENFMRIKSGMSSNEVVYYLGQPTRMDNKQVMVFVKDKMEATIMLHPSGTVREKRNKQGWPNDDAAVATEQLAAWKSKIDAVKLDLDEEEVTKILGDPTKTIRASAGRSAMVWEEETRFAIALFKDKKAISIESTLTPPENKDLSRSLYERAKMGATKEAVLANLGMPTEDNFPSLIWRQGNKFIILRFKDNVVSERQSSESGAPYVVFEKTDADRMNEALADLRSFDSKKRRGALGFFADTPFDETLAKEVSKLAQNALQDQDVFVRDSAGNVLRKWATAENADYFLRILNAPLTKKVDDPNRSKMPLAIDVLVKLRDPRAAAPLCKQLTSFFDRNDAAKALGQFGPEIASELTKHLNSKDFFVRKTCEDLLKNLKVDESVVLDRCLEDLKNADPERRGAAIARMMSIKVDEKRREDIAGVLEGHLNDKSFYTATISASLLGKWGSEKNEPALLALLKKTPSRDMKTILCKSLAQVGTPASVATLQPLTRDFETSLATAARDALVAIRDRKK